MNYEAMTLPELEKEKQELDKKRVDIKAEQLKLCAVLEKRVDEKKVKEKIEAMTDKEKKIATQILSAKAIVSEEEVGKPGAK